MEINWFTVIAQIINFLILVWLLKRFLYQPILDAIDAREQKIAAQLEDAATQKAEAQKAHDELQHKNEIFEQERSIKMAAAQDQINAEKTRLFDAAREESKALRAKYEAALKQEEQDIVANLKRKTRDEVFAIAGRALTDLANTSLEERLVAVLVHKMQTLDGKNKTKFKNALSHKDKSITIKSAFELPKAAKLSLEKAISTISGLQHEIQYKSAPELVSGIEINAKNYQLSWNIESYLESLKAGIVSPDQGYANH